MLSVLIIQAPSHLLVAITVRTSQAEVSEHALTLAHARSGSAADALVHARLLTAVTVVDRCEMALDGLTFAAEEELLCDELGVDNLPDNLPEGLLRRVRSRSRGNPFVSRELVRALLHTKQLAVARGRCEIATQIEARSAAGEEQESNSCRDSERGTARIQIEIPESLQESSQQSCLSRGGSAACCGREMRCCVCMSGRACMSCNLLAAGY